VKLAGAAEAPELTLGTLDRRLQRTRTAVLGGAAFVPWFPRILRRDFTRIGRLWRRPRSLVGRSPAADPTL